MITNKLAYFKTQSEFNALRNAGQIDSTTICFIEENRVIYTHGVEFTGARMLQYLEDIMDGLREEVKAADEALRDFIKSIEGRLNEEYERNKEEFNKAIEDARKAIEDARRALEQLEQDKADAWVEINKLQGSIKQQSEYYDKLEGRVTTMYQEMNAKNGTFEQFMQNVNTTLNTINGTITEFYSKIDVINGRFDEYLKKTDLDTEVVSIIGREADAENGTLKDFVKKTGPDGVMKYVEDYMNSTDPSFAEIAAVVTPLYAKLAGVLAFFDDDRALYGSSIFAKYTDKINNLDGTVDEHTKAIASLLAWVGDGEDGPSAGFDLTAALEDGVIQAKIWGIVKDRKSQLGLLASEIIGLAEYINFTVGDTKFELTDEQIKMIVDKVVIAADGKATTVQIGTSPNDIIISTDTGIKHNSSNSGNHGFVFNIDGSGNVANGRISWDKNGKITITTNSNDDLSLYGYSKITTTDITGQIDSHYKNTIQDWVRQQISAAQLGGDIGEEELKKLVEDYVNGEFKAELKQEYTPAINQSAAVVAKMYPSGTIFRDGKAYYPDYPTEATPTWERDIQTATAGMLTNTWWNTEKQSLVASASLLASVEDIMQNVTTTAVIEALADKLSSKVNISADQVNISGESITLSSKLTEIEGNLLVDGDVTAKAVEASGNLSGGTYETKLGSSFLIKSTKTSGTFSEGIIWFNPTMLNTTSGEVFAIRYLKSDYTYPIRILGDGSGSLADRKINWDSSGNVSFKTGVDSTVINAAFNNDGSGSLASGKITWDTSGNISSAAKIYSNQSGIPGSRQGNKYLDIENGTLTQSNTNLGNTVAVTIDNGLDVTINGQTLIEAKRINETRVNYLLSNSAKIQTTESESNTIINPGNILIVPTETTNNSRTSIGLGGLSCVSDGKQDRKIEITNTSNNLSAIIRPEGLTVRGIAGLTGYISLGNSLYMCIAGGIVIGFATSEDKAKEKLGSDASVIIPS